MDTLTSAFSWANLSVFQLVETGCKVCVHSWASHAIVAPLTGAEHTLLSIDCWWKPWNPGGYFPFMRLCSVCLRTWAWQAASIDQLDRLYFVTIAPLVVLLFMWLAHTFMPTLLRVGDKLRPAFASVLPMDQPVALGPGVDGGQAATGTSGQVDVKVMGEQDAEAGKPEMMQGPPLSGTDSGQPSQGWQLDSSPLPEQGLAPQGRQPLPQPEGQPGQAPGIWLTHSCSAVSASLWCGGAAAKAHGPPMSVAA